MLEKAIRKAVLSILLASLMVGAGCRITYAEEQQQTTESKVATDDTFVQAPSALLMEAGTGTVIYRKRSGHKTQSGKYYEDHDTDPDFRCVGEWYTENG